MTNKLEALQLENQKLKDHNRLLLGWISLISHDTKQLFSSLHWLIDAYQTEAIGLDDFLKMLPHIKKESQKNLNTATDTSEWLKTQFVQFTAKKDILDGFKLYEQLKEDYEAPLKAKELSFEFTGATDCTLVADKILLYFILKRILDNAIKYSYPSTTIRFNVSKLPNEYVLSVTDNGTGMSESSLKSMYTFEGALFEGTAGEIGSGLSLKIAQSFVDLMHGRMHIDSSKNEGTKVHIYLPHNS